MYFKYNTIVKQVKPNYFIETKCHRNYYYFKDDTEYIIYNSFYKIEYLYLVNKVKTDKFKIYEIEYLDNGSKVVYLRLLDSDLLRKVKIPKLDLYYEKEDVYCYKNVYIWKTKKGIKKIYTFNKLFNRHEHRYYRVGDINKYGHILEKITSEEVYLRSYKCLKNVGLKF